MKHTYLKLQNSYVSEVGAHGADANNDIIHNVEFATTVVDKRNEAVGGNTVLGFNWSTPM